jgi:hypothetical protein
MADEKPETVRVSKTTGEKLRATGSDSTDQERAAAAKKAAEVLRAKNEEGKA